MSETNGEPVLHLENVEVQFEQRSSAFGLFSEPQVVKAVDGVSLELGENEVLVLVGESGCGKTTLGKTAIGLQEPTSGSVRYRGQDIWDAKRKNGDVQIPYVDIRRALQIIHQDPGSSLNPNAQVISILSRLLKKWHDDLNRHDRRARVYGMLETVGMTPPEDYAHRYPHQLSGGEKQRVALIRALLINPDVILADEAISALDVSLRIEMMNLFLELQEHFNTSFLSISHDLSNARYFAEKADGRIGIMYLGKLVEIGPVSKVLNDPQHPYTKALRWATPNLNPDAESSEFPMRTIDIPDPTDPPSGCRYHTRCPEARETCRTVTPESETVSEDHVADCFMVADGTHDYWFSEPLVDDDHERTEPADDVATEN